MDEALIARLQQRVHPLIAIAVPFGFLTTVHHVLRVSIIARLESATPPGLTFLILAAGVVEVYATYSGARTRNTGAGTRVRQLLLLLLGAYVIMMITTGRVFRGEINPARFDVAYPLVLVLTQWLLSLKVHNALRDREAFLHIQRGLSGEALVRSVRESHDEATTAEQSLTGVKRMVIGFQVVNLLLMAAYLAVASPPRPVDLAVLFAHAGLGVLVIGALNGARQDQYLLGEGFILPLRLRRGRVVAGLAVIAAAAIIGVALAGRRSLLPMELIGDFFAWLNELLSGPDGRTRVVRAHAGERALGPEPPTGPTGDLSGLIGGEVSPIPGIIARVIGVGLAFAAGIGLVLFLVRPLSTGEWNLRTAFESLRAAVRRLGGRLVEAGPAMLRTAALFLARRRAAVRNVAEEIRDRQAGRRRQRDRQRVLAAAGGDRQTRRSAGSAIRAYLRIVRWGERGGVRFRSTLGPREYLQALARVDPNRADSLMEIGDRFERLVYSGRPQRQDLVRLAEDTRAVTRSKLKSVTRSQGSE